MDHVPHEHGFFISPPGGRLRVAIYIDTILSQLRGLKRYPPFRPDLKLLMALKHNFRQGRNFHYFYHIPHPLSSLFALSPKNLSPGYRQKPFLSSLTFPKRAPKKIPPFFLPCPTYFVFRPLPPNP